MSKIKLLEKKLEAALCNAIGAQNRLNDARHDEGIPFKQDLFFAREVEALQRDHYARLCAVLQTVTASMSP